MIHAMHAAASKTSGPLRLADHVRSCVVDDQVVLLDLHRSRYLGLSSRQWELLCERLRTPSASGKAGDQDDTIFAPLLRNRILTTAPTLRQPVLHTLAMPSTSFDADSQSQDLRVDPGQLRSFVAATARAALWLRFRSLHAISLALESRRREGVRGDAATQAARLHRATATFDRLRPLLFTSKEKCLYDSLALVLFLASQGVAARWVIGVATRPFRAHAWVQDGCEVLNDLHENVSRYRPIHTV